MRMYQIHTYTSTHIISLSFRLPLSQTLSPVCMGIPLPASCPNAGGPENNKLREEKEKEKERERERRGGARERKRERRREAERDRYLMNGSAIEVRIRTSKVDIL